MIARICIFAFATGGFAQQPLEFEAVSVRSNKTGPGSSRVDSNPGRLTAVNVSLKSLLARAYGMKLYQIDGPGWIDSEKFDVLAKYPDGLSTNREEFNSQVGTMLRRVLAERFKLKAHLEQKEVLVYQLLIGKSGIRFRLSQGDSHSLNTHNSHLVGSCISMDAFAEILSRQKDLPVDMPVLDRTGLPGCYDLTLDWTPESGDDRPVTISTRPTLAAAIEEQLGLKLEKRKAHVEVLVVDHAERVPSEN